MLLDNEEFLPEDIYIVDKNFTRTLKKPMKTLMERDLFYTEYNALH